MKMFFSAVQTDWLLDWLIDRGVTNFLFSYEDKAPLVRVKHLAKYTEKPLTILIDSGAFTAWNRNSEISVHEYMDFIEKVKSVKCVHNIQFLNLDVIPHVKGTIATPEQIARACERGIKNYHYLKECGHTTIHTFHQFENFAYLDLIIKECNDLNYIGISPANDQSVECRTEWLKDVFYRIRTDVHTHILGLTAKEMLEQIPCYSADSSSWKNVQRFGDIFDYHNLEKTSKTNLSKYNCLYYNPNGEFYDALNYYINLEKHITSVWNSREIHWNTSPLIK